MRENKEILQKETDAAFAFAAFLLNVLILLVLCGSVWILYSLSTQSNPLGSFLREAAWR